VPIGKKSSGVFAPAGAVVTSVHGNRTRAGLRGTVWRVPVHSAPDGVEELAEQQRAEELDEGLLGIASPIAAFSDPRYGWRASLLGSGTVLQTVEVAGLKSEGVKPRLTSLPQWAGVSGSVDGYVRARLLE
jgi:hypothetical protein